MCRYQHSIILSADKNGYRKGDLIMDSLTIYYDDNKLKCTKYAELFSKYDNVICKKASDFLNRSVIHEENENVGFLFESNMEKVPYAVSHIIWKLIMNKPGNCFVMVTGGSREISALRTARTDLERRGYHVNSIYLQYIFDKYHMDIQEAVEKMMSDFEMGYKNILHYKEKAKNFTSKQIKKKLRKELQSYKHYYRKKR